MTPDFLEAFANAWNRHDAEAVASMMTPDAVMCLSSGPTREGARFAGQEEIKSAANGVFARMPDVQWQNARHLIIGNRGITEWTLVATGANGEKIESNGCDLFEFRDGLIAFKDTYRKFPG